MMTMDYKWDMEHDQVQGFCKDQEAIARWIQRVLLVERNTYPQYEDSYGVEMEHLKGKPAIYQGFTMANLKRTIEEALLVREEILSVENFQFQTVEGQPDAIHVQFQVNTLFGSFLHQFQWNDQA